MIRILIMIELICTLAPYYTPPTTQNRGRPDKQFEFFGMSRLFYNGLSDTEIAEQLGDRALNNTVCRARIKLHLFRKFDLALPFDKDEFM